MCDGLAEEVLPAMMHRRHTLGMPLLIVLALFLGGCLFSPREPDGPPEGDQTNWQTPISTAIVLQNLRAAFEGGSPSNFRDCFTEDYEFHVDLQDSLDAGQEAEERYGNWTRDDEEQVAGSIFAAAGDISVKFANVEQPDETQTETYRVDDYEVVIEWKSGGHINEEITYLGQATLYMRKDETGRWAIFRWGDTRTAENHELNPTWGVLRGEHRS